ncbi:MAG: DUF4292 domain-containing protein [bacterium]
MKILRACSCIWIWSGLVFIILVFSDCGIPFFSFNPAAVMSSQTLLNKIHRNVQTLENFQGKAKLRMLSDEFMFKGSIRISMKRPDSVWMKIEGPMGIDVASVRAGGKQMQYYIPSEKVLYTGSVERLSDLHLVPWNVEVSSIFQSFLGLIEPPHTMPDSSIVYSSQDDAYLLPYSSDGSEEKIWIKPRGPVISRWERRDETGDPLWVWEGEMFYKRGRLRLPKFIQITQYNPRQRITFYYEIMNINHTLPADWYTLKIPEGVDKVEL